MEKAGLWNIHRAVYIGSGVVRVAIIQASGGTDLVLWAPGLSGSGPQQRLNGLSVEPATSTAHAHNSAANELSLIVQTPQLSPEERLPPGFKQTQVKLFSDR